MNDIVKEKCCGTCLHGGKNYFEGVCRLSWHSPRKVDINEICGAWHKK